MIAAALLLRGLSGHRGDPRVGLADVGFVAVAFTRLDCVNGPAGCGLGGRFAVSGASEVAHWMATTVSTVLLIAA
jgi:hypothetical protein